MKKRIQKHIDKQEYVKVYICDKDGTSISHSEGFIFEQNDKLVMMSDSMDFHYDGIVVLKKVDISEIKRTDNEKFFQMILEEEGLKKEVFVKKEKLNFHLDSYEKMFNILQKRKTPITIDAKYGTDGRFLIGPVMECNTKRVRINYFNTRGEFDLKFVACKYKEISTLKIDSPYANLFSKYVKEIN